MTIAIALITLNLCYWIVQREPLEVFIGVFLLVLRFAHEWFEALP